MKEPEAPPITDLAWRVMQNESARGKENWKRAHRRLSLENRKFIQMSSLKPRELAEKYKVSTAHIYNIRAQGRRIK